MRSSPYAAVASARCGRGRGRSSTQVRVGRALAADGGRGAVAGQHEGVVGQRQDLVAQAGASSRRMSPPGRSVRPIEPANSTSPVRQSCSASRRPAPGSRNITDPPVWPGRVVDGRAPARRASSAAPSVSSHDVVRLGPGQPAAELRRAGRRDRPLAGSASSSRSSGWMYAVMPRAPQTGVTEKMWSRWPWVSSTAAGLSRCSASTSSSRSIDPDARVDDDALLPRRGRDHVAVGAEGLGGKAGDEHDVASSRRAACPTQHGPARPVSATVEGTAQPVTRAGRTRIPRSATRTLWRACGVATDADRRRLSPVREGGSTGGFQQGPAAQLWRGPSSSGRSPGGPAAAGAAGRSRPASARPWSLALLVAGRRSGRPAASTAEQTAAAAALPRGRRSDAGEQRLKDVGKPPTKDMPTNGAADDDHHAEPGRPVTVELDPTQGAVHGGRASPTWPARSSSTTPSATGSPRARCCSAATRPAPAAAARPTGSRTRTCRPPAGAPSAEPVGRPERGRRRHRALPGRHRRDGQPGRTPTAASSSWSSRTSSSPPNYTDLRHGHRRPRRAHEDRRGRHEPGADGAAPATASRRPR